MTIEYKEQVLVGNNNPVCLLKATDDGSRHIGQPLLSAQLNDFNFK